MINLPDGSTTRRLFIKYATLLTGAMLVNRPGVANSQSASVVPHQALPLHHFPNSLYAFVWRNWGLVSLARMASTVGATADQLSALASSMGLRAAPPVSADQWERSYLTVIRRNWHLLPKPQLVELMGWDEAQLDFTLKEDDFFFIKLGSIKPACPVIHYHEQVLAADDPALTYLQRVIAEEFPSGLPIQQEPYFQFVQELSDFVPSGNKPSAAAGFSPRIAYPYFALFGDPLLSDTTGSYPDGYLARMAASGVDHIWMHIVLSKLTPFPWDPAQSQHWETRLANLRKLTERCRKHGIGIYLYLNEPRNQDDAFFQKHPTLRGEGNSLCTSLPEVRNYLQDSLALIMERAPQLAGFFSITASENRTNCWSHQHGHACPRCGTRGAATVIAELNNCYLAGIKKGLAAAQVTAPATAPRLIIWDWGWPSDWPEAVIPQLTNEAIAFMSVSEWDLPIARGGIPGKVGEYSVSAIGPGPRASKHWQVAQDHGVPTVAKIQANNSWEIGAVPYIPALYNVAEHVSNLRNAGVSGLMLGWSLGGYPSPNLQVAALLGNDRQLSAEAAVQQVAQNRYGQAADTVLSAWRGYSDAFREFPYHISVVYFAPLQSGPSNLLWLSPTGYAASMVGIAYDDLEKWRAIYPVSVFVSQLRKVATGFEAATEALQHAILPADIDDTTRKALQQDINIAKTVAYHYASVANQSEFIAYRDSLPQQNERERAAILNQLRQLLHDEIRIAKGMAALQRSDSRLGYEASNHYFYVPSDLDEKVLNCRYLLDQWLPLVQ